MPRTLKTTRDFTAFLTPYGKAGGKCARERTSKQHKYVRTLPRFGVCSTCRREGRNVWSGFSALGMNQPGMVVNPACEQLNRENIFFTFPRSLLRIWSRKTDSVFPSPVSPLILHTRAESSIINYQSSIINLVLTHGIPPAFRNGVKLCRQPPSGQSRVYYVTQMRTSRTHCGLRRSHRVGGGLWPRGGKKR